jgi:hypothetical protein
MREPEDAAMMKNLERRPGRGRQRAAAAEVAEGHSNHSK